MKVMETILLGIIQGLTEFLPISSSGHLVVFQNLLGLKKPELLLDCSLHVGTLLAVCIYFRSDLKLMFEGLVRTFTLTAEKGGRISLMVLDPYTSLAWWVVVGSIPTAVIALVFKRPLESLFGSVQAVGFMLIATGVILALTQVIRRDGGKKDRVGLGAALAVGLAQGLAIIPGISRSGATIACGLICGLDRELAGRFSFILSIPAIIGALATQLNLHDIERVGAWGLLVGVLASTIVGLAALKVLMGIVKKGKLSYFAPYCWAIGLVVIIAM